MLNALLCLLAHSFIIILGNYFERTKILNLHDLSIRLSSQ